jgi:glycosyltransferase involved in cell wall biosynthesis
LPLEIARRLEGRLVIGYVGSVNHWYEARAALALFKNVRARRPDAILLGLCSQTDELSALVQESGIAAHDALITSAPNSEMPAWLGAIRWGFLLLRPCFAKRASMPTKLGEFFASGVRPISHGCNVEVDQWVDRAGSGVVVSGLDDAALAAAAELIAAADSDPEALQRARERTRPHFGLEQAVDRYAALYDRLS